MELDEILDQINQVFRQVFEDENIKIEPTFTANDVDGWDSLNHMILISEIEKFFDVKFALREIIRLKEVNDISLLIQKKKS